MPPKKRGRGRGKAAPAPTKTSPAKRQKIKVEEEDEEPPTKLMRDESINSKIQRIIKEEKKSSSEKVYKPDLTLLTYYHTGEKIAIFEDYTCMLNQTNIGQNNNKFYVIQIATINGGKKGYTVFTKWGRVGESGQDSTSDFTDAEAAIKLFKKKFTDKTKNKWENRENFSPAPGKYTMIEISQESDDEEMDEVDSKNTDVKKLIKETNCTLDKRTQLLVKIIFNDDMFVDQMAAMNLDVKKMPLGKLSQSQILKGLQALLEIEKEIQGKASAPALERLTSKFYTLIPHSFGRTVPPVISLQSIVDQKKEMMMTLTDIEMAQSLQKKQEVNDTANVLDVNYESLDCKLERVENNSEEFKLLQKYSKACKSTRRADLLDVWKVDRSDEGIRFKKHDDISYRKLLWHGTNVAVVAAILKAGLRIMPHSGGLVGKGIYFASEYDKSSGYVSEHYGTFEGEKNVGFMFLTEVALGKMSFIKQCNSRLTKAPNGYDSIVARGQNEPDPAKDVKRKFEGKEVLVPVGTPVPQKEFKDSGFYQSEYLVYKESQARIRYLLKFSFKN